jgi:hypothetical protein
MTQRIDLPGVTLTKDGERLTVTHHATGTSREISAEALVRWLVRKLRELF